MNHALDCSSILIPILITIALLILNIVSAIVKVDFDEEVVGPSIVIGVLGWAVWLIYAVVTLSKVANAVAT